MFARGVRKAGIPTATQQLNVVLFHRVNIAKYRLEQLCCTRANTRRHRATVTPSLAPTTNECFVRFCYSALKIIYTSFTPAHKLGHQDARADGVLLTYQRIVNHLADGGPFMCTRLSVRRQQQCIVESVGMSAAAAGFLLAAAVLSLSRALSLALALALSLSLSLSLSIA